MENKLVDCKCGGKPDTDHDEDGVLIMVWCPDCEQYLAKENPPDDETLFDFWNRINAVPDSGDEKLIAEIRRVCKKEWRTGCTGKDATDKVIEVAIEIIEAYFSKAVPDSGDVDWENLIQEIKNLPECEKHIYWDEMPDGSKYHDGDNGAEPISKWAVIRIIHALAAKTGGQE